MSAGGIRTPDQRLRVFVSSTLSELAAERAAARSAIESLRLTPVLFELGARPHPPRDLYAAYLAQSDIFVGVYWQEYGWVAPDMGISGLEDEYDLCGAAPRLLYVKEPAPRRDSRLRALIERIEADGLGSYRVFSSASELAELLRDDLAVMLSERFVHETGVGAAVAGRPAAPLPAQPTSLVGRDRDLAAVCRLVRAPSIRLVTLTGPGGIGKTRLAIAAAQGLEPDFAGGAHFVALAAIRDPGLVLSTVATAVGASLEHRRRPLDALADHFDGPPALLVLDNVEQVVDAGHDLVDLLAVCPALTVLITSRIVLRVRGEHEYPVPALDVPPPDAGRGGAPLPPSPATQLFVDRARAVRHDFELTGDQARAVAEICRRLEGIPLAIELAAARVRLLSPTALLAHLACTLDALGAGPADLPERQRTLRSTIAWSFGLLDDGLARVLATLAVFADGWTLEAAARVCELDDLAMLEALDALAGHSLVLASPTTDEPRFRMLETVREYAGERLADRSDASEVAARHAAYFCELVDRADRPLRGGDQALWAARLDSEHGNVRATMRWLLDHDRVADAAHLCRVAFLAWWLNDRMSEILPWLEEALARIDHLDTAAQAELLWSAAFSAMEVGDHDAGLRHVDRAVPLTAEAGDPYLHATGLLVRGYLRPVEGDLTGALADNEAALAALRALDEPFLTGIAMSSVGTFKMIAQGDHAAARRYQREALEMGGRIGNDRLIAQSMNQLALVAVMEGELAEARSLLTPSAALFLRAGSAEGVALTCSVYAWLALREGDARRAALAMGAAAAHRRRVGIVVWPAIEHNERQLVDRIRTELGPEAFTAAWEAGERLSLREAVEAASGVRATASA